jgi:hypothetical protein
VLFQSTGQELAADVLMLLDYADAVRVKQKPLPQIGSWGVVIFPYGDIRNGIWLGAYLPSGLDAMTATQASGSAPTDPFIDYESTFSGHWRLLDGLGNLAEQFADGSYIVAASGTTLPTAYRHTVDASNAQQRIPFTYAERVTAPPSPFNFFFKHATGTTIEVDTSGSVAVSGVSALNIVIGGTTLSIGNTGTATIALAGGDKLNITQGGSSPSDFLTLVSKLIDKFNNHTHKLVQAGTANSGTPTTNLSASDISSTIIGISD